MLPVVIVWCLGEQTLENLLRSEIVVESSNSMAARHLCPALLHENHGAMPFGVVVGLIPLGERVAEAKTVDQQES